MTEGHPYIAIGEVGMDLYWDKTYLKEQQAALDEQIHWALEYDLPLIIHCREAFPELFEVLSPYKNTNLSGIFHSFTEMRKRRSNCRTILLSELESTGWSHSRKSTLPETLKNVPLSKIVLETDSPYLTPCPTEGKEMRLPI